MTDSVALSESVLPMFFKHGNFSSFVRQLHLYGFHKATSSQEHITFSNFQFLRGRGDLLEQVIRKKTTRLDRQRDVIDDLRQQLDELQEQNQMLIHENRVLQNRIRHFESKCNKNTPQEKKKDLEFFPGVPNVRKEQLSFYSVPRGDHRNNSDLLSYQDCIDPELFSQDPLPAMDIDTSTQPSKVILDANMKIPQLSRTPSLNNLDMISVAGDILYPVSTLEDQYLAFGY